MFCLRTLSSGASAAEHAWRLQDVARQLWMLGCGVGSEMWLCCMQYRWNVFKGIRQAIEDNEGGLDKFSQGETHLHCCQAAGQYSTFQVQCFQCMKLHRFTRVQSHVALSSSPQPVLAPNMTDVCLLQTQGTSSTGSTAGSMRGRPASGTESGLLGPGCDTSSSSLLVPDI